MPSRADIHVHTKYSGVGKLGPLRFPESIADPRDVVNNARSLGIDVLCITDHDSIEGALKASDYAAGLDDIEVVIGEEVSTADGELIGLFLTEKVEPGLSAEETIARIREQNGLVIAPHPFSLHVPAVGERIFDLDLDGIETINAGHIDTYANRKAIEASSSGRWATLGGSDAHSLPTMGYAFTEFNGTGAEGLREAILAKRTVAKGNPMPLEKAINWSVGVVLATDVWIIRSVFGKIKEVDMHDPIVNKISVMDASKKAAALIGSILFLLPPVPFLCGIVSKKVLKRMERNKQNGGGQGLKDL